MEVNLGLLLLREKAVKIFVKVNVKMEQSNNTDTGDTNNTQPTIPVPSPRVPLVRNLVCESV